MKKIKLTDVIGLGLAKAKDLEASGIDSVEKLATVDASVICAIPNFKEALTAKLQENAKTLLGSTEHKAKPEVKEEEKVTAVTEEADGAEETLEVIAEEPVQEEVEVPAKTKKAKSKKSNKKKSKDKKSGKKKSKAKKKDKKNKKSKKK